MFVWLNLMKYHYALRNLSLVFCCLQQAAGRPLGGTGPLIQLPDPRLPTQPLRAFLVAIGPALNSEVLANPAPWRPVNIGPGGAARRLSMGIIRMTGERHAYYRRLLSPPLQRRSIDANGTKLAKLARESIANWQ